MNLPHFGGFPLSVWASQQQTKFILPTASIFRMVAAHSGRELFHDNVHEKTQGQRSGRWPLTNPSFQKILSALQPAIVAPYSKRNLLLQLPVSFQQSVQKQSLYSTLSPWSKSFIKDSFHTKQAKCNKYKQPKSNTRPFLPRWFRKWQLPGQFVTPSNQAMFCSAL